MWLSRLILDHLNSMLAAGFPLMTSTTSVIAVCASVGELLQNQVRVGLNRLERIIKGG